MYCTKDCACSLCRELRAYKVGKLPKRPAPNPPSSLLGRMLNDNFILRRRAGNGGCGISAIKSFQPQSLKNSEMYQQRPSPLSYPQQQQLQLQQQLKESKRDAVTPSPTPVNELPENGTFSSKSKSSRKDVSQAKPSSQSVKTNHKVVIYFGDSIANRGKNSNSNIKPNETRTTSNNMTLATTQLIQEMSQKLKRIGKTSTATITATTTTASALTGGIFAGHDAKDGNANTNTGGDGSNNNNNNNNNDNDNNNNDELPSYIESVQNGVINIKIEGNYQRASALVESVAKPTLAAVGKPPNETKDVGDTSDDDDDGDDNDGDDNNAETASQSGSCDWSFVQEWRARPTGNMPLFSPSSTQALTQSQTTGLPPPPHTSGNQASSAADSSGRNMNLAVATPAPRVFKEVAQQPGPNATKLNAVPFGGSTHFDNYHLSEKPVVSPPAHVTKAMPQRSVACPTRLTVQSTPVKSQPPMLSASLKQQQTTNCLQSSQVSFQKSPKASATSNLNSPTSIGIPTDTVFQHSPSPRKLDCGAPRTHHHEFRALHRVQECHSSSDENRSSGHASMSDTGGHGSSSPGGGMTLGPLPEDRLAAGVTNRSTRSRSSANHPRPRHRGAPVKSPWSGSGLEDIKMAIQQLTMRSQTSTSTYSSLSAGSESSEPARRLGRYSSLETVNTNVTNADEFVWVDSHNRLVELQHPPWSQHCIMRVIRNGRCKDQADSIAVEVIPRLGYLLQRALVRIAREVQRLSSGLGLCSKQEVASAFKIVLCPALADSCTKACLRAAAMFAVSGESALKQSKSARAGVQLSVGRFYRWMADARLGKFVHEYAAIYLCAGIENLLEEILLQSSPVDATNQLTATTLEHSIAGSGDMWGLLQPFAHLNAGRIASGALTMPRWASQSSLGSTLNQSSVSKNNASIEPCLLTTCVGSISELKELALRTQQKFQHAALSSAALSALFYFMRCSQLEHTEITAQATGQPANGSSQNVQELCYERAYVVLPPLVEWLRVSSAHAEYRSAVMIDKDDVMQAARLLLPGVDCPIRPIGHDEELPTKKTHFSHPSGTTTPVATSGISEDTSELGKRATISVAFKLMLTGRAELLAQASNLLPPTTRYDTLNHAGMSALMIASIRNDEIAIQALLDAGCDPNVEVPVAGSGHCPAIHPDTQHWTAVTFAASRSNYIALRILLERGGKVEGGARMNEEKTTLTPLQVACGTGNLEIVSLLLAHGANSFLSTQLKDPVCFAGSAQKGCFCAISVAAAHGHRSCLRKLLSHPVSPGARDVLSLEEMLAEGDVASGRNANVSNERSATAADVLPMLNKAQIKSLQEAMYHSAENNHLDITIELRKLGVPWTLHCWMHALSAAHELRLDAVIDQLLQDFLQVCPDDYSVQFVSECLPLLFNIFRYSKNEGTTLLLADIFATCFGWETLPPVKEPILQPINSSRIDPKFVNNPELSDVTFRVEGKIFYGHKIVLVTASPRFQSMLSSKLSETNTPTVQINDIRYHIFQLVMQFLYSGGCNALEVSHSDVLELMAAASFFQLEGLLRYTEARCSEMVDIDNVVAMYIHAKVYNANSLLEYCQGFLLQNMVALLTYDDSVKRLLFAKKIPNHDVLSGLLQALQQRIKTRKPNSLGAFRHQLGSTASSMTGNSSISTSGSINNGIVAKK